MKTKKEEATLIVTLLVDDSLVLRYITLKINTVTTSWYKKALNSDFVQIVKQEDSEDGDDSLSGDDYELYHFPHEVRTCMTPNNNLCS